MLLLAVSDKTAPYPSARASGSMQMAFGYLLIALSLPQHEGTEIDDTVSIPYKVCQSAVEFPACFGKHRDEQVKESACLFSGLD